MFQYNKIFIFINILFCCIFILYLYIYSYIYKAYAILHTLCYFVQLHQMDYKCIFYTYLLHNFKRLCNLFVIT